MMKTFSRWGCIAAFCALALSSAMAHAQETKGEAKKETKLPEAVRKTFEGKFPKAKIEKVDVEKEEGVEVYDFEFRDGKTEKECDIAADGTMLEYTIVIRTKDVPEEAMKPIREAAEGATMGRTEKIEVSYELKDGKIIKLPKPVMQYAVEMKKGEKHAEIIVDAQGKVIEAPEWVDPKAKKTPA
jgi:uncharacterized membrane protein YkoI